MRDQDRINWPDNEYPRAKFVRSQSEKELANNSAINAQVTIYVPGGVARTVANVSTPRCQGVV